MRITDRVEEASSTKVAAHREILKRVLSSATFGRAERLSTLLLYLCEQSFKGNGRDLSEQHLGEEVFGRARGYDCSIDGIVRTQASRLRQRLTAYFDGEGLSEPIRIIVPPGGYVPIFEPNRTAQAQEHLNEDTQSTIPPVDTPALLNEPRAERFRRLPWLLCGVLAISTVANFVMHRGADSVSHAQRLSNSNPLWRRIFNASRPTILVPADSGLVLFEAMAKHATSLNEYIRGDYRALAMDSNDPMQAMELNAANSRYTSIVDLEMAVGLSQVASDRDTRLDIRYARDLRPNDLKSVNAVLSGAAQANPWVQLFEQHMNFTLEADPQTRSMSVINRAPLVGEPRRWESTLNDTQHRVYGVVAFVSNLTGDGDVLILEGTSMPGTEAAWNYVMEDAKLMPFIKSIQRPDGSVPHFEVLIATNNMGFSAVETSVVAWRVEK